VSWLDFRRKMTEVSMANGSRVRTPDPAGRQQWTGRLNRFAAAKTSKQRQALLDTTLKINPGGTLRDMLAAWGYSASSRGRKAKGQENGASQPARARLEAALEAIFGNSPSPVPSLYAKLAGRLDLTVKDACRIVSALLTSWPDTLALYGDARTPAERAERARQFAETFMRELLSDLSMGRAHDWTDRDMAIRVFRLVNEERIGISTFIKEAGEQEGALIIGGIRNILIDIDPVHALRAFHDITSQFVGPKHKGILIFVFNAAIFEAGENGFDLLYNIGQFSAAMTAFALFSSDYRLKETLQEHRVDWSRWRTLSRRCCVVIRKPTVVHPTSGQLLKGSDVDEFISGWRPNLDFSPLKDLQGFVRFDANHILPYHYPREFGNVGDVSGRDLYWDVVVRPNAKRDKPLDVQYFIPPIQRMAARSESSNAQRTRGRPASAMTQIEEDLFYVVKQDSPGERYDEAQRAIYMAARGRLNLDTEDLHDQNMNAAAALRNLGFEVLPISMLLYLFPRALHFATAHSNEIRIENKIHAPSR
jgi:hypothetical protein